MRNELSGTRVPATEMRIRVRGREPMDRPELRTYVEHRLHSTLGHLSRAVDCVAVTGERIEVGPHRGAFRCRIWARLLRGHQVREEQTDRDVYAAIDGAAEALARDVEHLESRLPPGRDLRCA